MLQKEVVWKYTYENINNTRDQTALEPLLE